MLKDMRSPVESWKETMGDVRRRWSSVPGTSLGRAPVSAVFSVATARRKFLVTSGGWAGQVLRCRVPRAPLWKEEKSCFVPLSSFVSARLHGPSLITQHYSSWTAPAWLQQCAPAIRRSARESRVENAAAARPSRCTLGSAARRNTNLRS